MGQYAAKTEVSADRSLDEIRRVLKRYEAKNFLFGEMDDQVAIMFDMRNRRLRFVVPLPDPKDRAFTITPKTRRSRSADAAQSAYEQAVRQRYRALLLTIKAKLESVEAGIEQFEEAFLAQIVLPDGRTVGKWSIPQVEQAYDTNTMPPLLASGE